MWVDVSSFPTKVFFFYYRILIVFSDKKGWYVEVWNEGYKSKRGAESWLIGPALVRSVL
jgi:hypothetical protein